MSLNKPEQKEHLHVKLTSMNMKKGNKIQQKSVLLSHINGD